MRVGLIARCDDRGLGHMTWEFARAMRPDRILVVVLDPTLGKEFVQHLERFDDLASEWLGFVDWSGGELPRRDLDFFLDGLDVVYSAETFYDPGLVPLAERRGVATVLHSMPEFHRADLPRPTATWLPTSWRAAETPHEAVVPVPVALDRFEHVDRGSSERTRWLHVAGNRAALDRNGTSQVLAAVRRLRRPARVEFAVQRGKIPRPVGRMPVEIVHRGGAPAEYWRLYDGVDALVLPRRYGGLCLPVQEAMAAGLAVVLPDCSPNEEWPAVLVPARRSTHLRTAAGLVQTWTSSPGHLASTMDRLADPAALAAAQAASRAWAVEHSWEALRPLYVEQLERVLSSS